MVCVHGPGSHAFYMGQTCNTHARAQVGISQTAEYIAGACEISRTYRAGPGQAGRGRASKIGYARTPSNRRTGEEIAM